MRAQRTRDTGPEMELRRRLHAMGLRYRVQRRVLREVRRHHDLVFGPARLVVEVMGCYWHGCPRCFRGGPKSNSDWWHEKIQRNRARDLDSRRRLEAAGWEVVWVWEHEDMDAAAERVARLARERRR